MPSFESSFILGAQQLVFATSWMPQLIVFLARYLILVYFFAPLFVWHYLSLKQRSQVMGVFWSMGCAMLLVVVLSRIVARDRPFIADLDITLLIPPPLNQSFPSGHTATSAAAATALFEIHPLLGLLGFLVMAFIAMARIAAGAHYPSDILGGMVVGVLAAWIVREVTRALQRRDIEISAAHHHHDDEI